MVVSRDLINQGLSEQGAGKKNLISSARLLVLRVNVIKQVGSK